MIVTKDTTIEELVEKLPGAVKYLMEKGIRCIICGEPIWGTLETAAKEKGFDDAKIQQFIEDLNKLALNPSNQTQSKPIVDIPKIDLNKNENTNN